MPEIETSLAALRRKRGLSAVQLAAAAGVSRQTIYAMEAGTYIPNTVVALRLARALASTVEELFALPHEEPGAHTRTKRAALLPGSAISPEGQPVQLCRVGNRLIASAPSPFPWYFPATDAIVSGTLGTRGKSRVQLLGEESIFANRILIAGCDPGISVLARHAQAPGIHLVLAHRNSTQALALLKEGSVHVAGTHLRDESSGESNLPEIERLFPKNSVAVISFAVWEEGIVTARGNPKKVRNLEDFARPDILIVNREKGSGSRALLDRRLKQTGIRARAVAGYEHSAPGHLPAAWQVQAGAADCCLATRAAARIFGLHFIPLASERYDLVVRRQHLEQPGIQNLFDTLGRLGFRRELEGLGGYDVNVAGRRML